MTGQGPAAGADQDIQARTCPWCGSADVTLVTRGFAGLTDERDQYFTCAACGRVTYEMVSKTAREVRMERFKAGDTYNDRRNRTRYRITRVLRVGTNETLVYLRPLDPGEADA